MPFGRAALVVAAGILAAPACTIPDHTFNDAEFARLSMGGTASSPAGTGGSAGDASGGAGEGGSAGDGGASIGGDAGAGGTSDVGGSGGENGGTSGHGGSSAGSGGDGGSAGVSGSGGAGGSSGAAGVSGSGGGDAGGGGGVAGTGGAGAGGSNVGGASGAGGASGGAGESGASGSTGASGASAGGGSGAAGSSGAAGGSAGAAGSSGVGGAAGSSGSAGASAGQAGSAGAGGSVSPPPTVTSITPSDGTDDVPSASSIALTFSEPMDATSLTVQSADGPCTGTIQVSCDGSGFATCVGLASVDVDSVTATVMPVALPAGEVCETRVTTGATSTDGVAMSAAYTSSGFTVAAPAGACSMPDVVISQVFGGGGNSGSKWKNDFIELFNRSNHAVKLDGWSVQYAASNSMSWVATDLTGTIQPGAYFLVAEAQGTGGTADLPTPQVTGALTMGGTSGKVALVRATSILGTSCATDAAVVDFVAYGSSTVCTSFTSSLSSTTSALRKDAGCGYSGVVATDFSVGPVSPRNATTPVVTCTVCN